MKKYIKPIVKIVEIENENILAGSDVHDQIGGHQLGKKIVEDDYFWEDEEE